MSHYMCFHCDAVFNKPAGRGARSQVSLMSDSCPQCGGKWESARFSAGFYDVDYDPRTEEVHLTPEQTSYRSALK